MLETLISVVSVCNIFVTYSFLMGQGTGNVEDVLPSLSFDDWHLVSCYGALLVNYHT